jgi:hypothetical protein
MERLHGPQELVPWQSKRADALTRHIENVALTDEAQDPFAGAEVIYAYTRKDALADALPPRPATRLPYHGDFRDTL